MTETAKRGAGPESPRSADRRANLSRSREPPHAAHPLAIGDLARAFRISTRTIRFYEARGLLRPARRGATRVFSQSDCLRLALIIRAKNLGLTLEEIGEHLAIYDAAPTSPEQAMALRARTDRHIETLAGKRNDLQTTLRELRDIRARLTAQAAAERKT